MIKQILTITVLVLLVSQFDQAYAENFLSSFTGNATKAFEKVTETIPEISLEEELIRNALAIGEDYAIKIGIEVGYDFSKTYFENYQNFNMDDIDFKRVLLAVILHHDDEFYYEIIGNNPFLIPLELEKKSQSIIDFKTEVTSKYTILGEYDKDAWNIIKTSVETKIILKQVNQTGLDELDKPRSVDEELAIALIKALPAYDMEEEKVTTVDDSLSKTISKIPELEGSDFERDSIRTGVIIASDPEYVMYLNIIKTDDGWISMEEALLYNYKSDDVRRAELALKTIDFAMDVKKIEDPKHKVTEFVDIINEINYETEKLID